jgi:hypothetical protein
MCIYKTAFYLIFYLNLLLEHLKKFRNVRFFISLYKNSVLIYFMKFFYSLKFQI